MIDFSKMVLAPLVSTFGEPVTFVDRYGSRHQIMGIFDDSFLEEKFEGEGFVATRKPRLGVRVLDLSGSPDPIDGDSFRIPGDAAARPGPYWVVKGAPEADGIGWLRIDLLKVA